MRPPSERTTLTFRFEIRIVPLMQRSLPARHSAATARNRISIAPDPFIQAQPKVERNAACPEAPIFSLI
jgi:hypothetical protein